MLVFRCNSFWKNTLQSDIFIIYGDFEAKYHETSEPNRKEVQKICLFLHKMVFPMKKKSSLPAEMVEFNGFNSNTLFLYDHIDLFMPCLALQLTMPRAGEYIFSKLVMATWPNVRKTKLFRAVADPGMVLVKVSTSKGTIILPIFRKIPWYGEIKANWGKPSKSVNFRSLSEIYQKCTVIKLHWTSPL